MIQNQQRLKLATDSNYPILQVTYLYSYALEKLAEQKCREEGKNSYIFAEPYLTKVIIEH